MVVLGGGAVSYDRSTPVGGLRVRILRASGRDLSPFGSLRSRQRALSTKTKVESGTSQLHSGTSVHLSDSGILSLGW